eukprot:768701-Hanusia_phi.AAC.5
MCKTPVPWGDVRTASETSALPRTLQDTQNVAKLSDSLRNFKVKRLSAGHSHSAVLTGDGVLWICGSSRQGQLGIGDVASAMSPLPLPSLPPVVDVRSAALFSSVPEA